MKQDSVYGTLFLSENLRLSLAFNLLKKIQICLTPLLQGFSGSKNPHLFIQKNTDFVPYFSVREYIKQFGFIFHPFHAEKLDGKVKTCFQSTFLSKKRAEKSWILLSPLFWQKKAVVKKINPVLHFYNVFPTRNSCHFYHLETIIKKH